MSQEKTKKVWVNGCFDVLHLGHIRLLEFAKSQGDVLYVGIDSDDRVKKSKGEKRPINCEDSRKEFLYSLKHVDRVIVFKSDEELLRLTGECDIMVIGEEYMNRKIIKHPKTDLVFFPKLEGFSSTLIINKSEYIDQKSR